MVNKTNPRVAAMLYQGVVQEALYAKYITGSARYKDIIPQAFCNSYYTCF